MTSPTPSEVIDFLSSSKGDDSHLIVNYRTNDNSTNTLSSAVRASPKLATIVLISSDSTRPILHIIIHNETDENNKKSEDFCILINQQFEPSIMKIEPQFHESSPIKTIQITSFNLDELKEKFASNATVPSAEEIIAVTDDDSLLDEKISGIPFAQIPIHLLANLIPPTKGNDPATFSASSMLAHLISKLTDKDAEDEEKDDYETIAPELVKILSTAILPVNFKIFEDSTRNGLSTTLRSTTKRNRNPAYSRAADFLLNPTLWNNQEDPQPTPASKSSTGSLFFLSPSPSEESSDSEEELAQGLMDNPFPAGHNPATSPPKKRHKKLSKATSQTIQAACKDLKSIYETPSITSKTDYYTHILAMSEAKKQTAFSKLDQAQIDALTKINRSIAGIQLNCLGACLFEFFQSTKQAASISKRIGGESEKIRVTFCGRSAAMKCLDHKALEKFYTEEAFNEDPINDFKEITGVSIFSFEPKREEVQTIKTTLGPNVFIPTSKFSVLLDQMEELIRFYMICFSMNPSVSFQVHSTKSLPVSALHHDYENEPGVFKILTDAHSTWWNLKDEVESLIAQESHGKEFLAFLAKAIHNSMIFAFKKFFNNKPITECAMFTGLELPIGSRTYFWSGASKPYHSTGKHRTKDPSKSTRNPSNNQDGPSPHKSTSKKWTGFYHFKGNAGEQIFKKINELKDIPSKDNKKVCLNCMFRGDKSCYALQKNTDLSKTLHHGPFTGIEAAVTKFATSNNLNIVKRSE